MLVGEIDRDITEMELQYGVSAGIQLHLPFAGMVPTYDEHSARLERNIGLAEWEAMHFMEKALVIAVWRNQNAIRNQQAEAEIREAKRKKPKG